MTPEQMNELLLKEEAEYKRFNESASAELNYRNGRISILKELLLPEVANEPINGSVVGE